MDRLKISFISKKTETPQTPETEKKAKPRHSRHPSLAMPLSPRKLFQDLKITTEKPTPTAWTDKLMGKADGLIRHLAEGKDVSKEARSLLAKASGLKNPTVLELMVGKVKTLPDDLRGKVHFGACKAQESAEAEVAELLGAVSEAASSLNETFESDGTSYGTKDPELDPKTDKLSYLARWAEETVRNCSTTTLIKVFDGLVAKMSVAGIHSRIGTALLDALLPKIASDVTEDVLYALMKGANPREADDRFLWFIFYLQKTSPDSIAPAIDEALNRGCYSKAQLRQMDTNLSTQNSAVDIYLSDRINARIDRGPRGVKAMTGLLEACAGDNDKARLAVLSPDQEDWLGQAEASLAVTVLRRLLGMPDPRALESSSNC